MMLWASASLKNAHTLTWLACAGVPDGDGALALGDNVTPPVSFFALSPLHELTTRQSKPRLTIAANVFTVPPALILNLQLQRAA
jgi:hypothetical protein